jgi:hypothetical protein
MDKLPIERTVVEGMARLAGLERALAEFPECVANAAAQALGRSGEIRSSADPAAEPWPPMKVGGAS